MASKRINFNDDKLFASMWEVASKVLAWKGREELRMTTKIITALESISTEDEDHILPGMDRERDPATGKETVKAAKDFPDLPRCRILKNHDQFVVLEGKEIDFFLKCTDDVGGGAVAAKQMMPVVVALETAEEVDVKKLLSVKEVAEEKPPQV